jgi:DNA polymerase-1
MDSAVAAYLLDPSSGRYRLEDVVDAQLGVALDGSVEARAAGQLDLEGTAVGDGVAQADEAARQAVALGAVVGPLRAALENAGLTRLYDEVERPLVRVLAKMEVAGIGVDRGELRRITDGFIAECGRLEAEIHRQAGEVFNVNSTPQLRAVLYERLGLTPGKKTKTGFSTDAQTLEKIKDQHPVVETLLRYREVEKLRSTYGESLLGEVGEDGRIHATFQQTVARTGRLSSDRPNLHNIPVRTEEGRQLRKAFVPSAGHRLLVADYDQIELRVIAHLADDPGLIGAFAAGEDIHRTTAARVFGVPAEEVTGAQRNRAKMVSYGLAYGMEAFGLAQRLGIETREAQEILDAYFSAFPSVRAHMEQTVNEARSKGYTETLFGRRRSLPDLHSPNRGLRMAAERQAMNAGIQGLAADLFKVALVRLDGALEEQGLASRLVLQVHDEVLVEVPEAEEKTVGALVPEVLSGVADAVGLKVPLKVSSAWGSSWADAKG